MFLDLPSFSKNRASIAAFHSSLRNHSLVVVVAISFNGEILAHSGEVSGLRVLRVASEPASLKLVFVVDFDVSHNYSQLLLVDVKFRPSYTP